MWSRATRGLGLERDVRVVDLVGDLFACQPGSRPQLRRPEKAVLWNQELQLRQIRGLGRTGTSPRGNPPEGKRRDFPWASILRAPQGEGANNSPICAQGTSWVTRPTVQRHFLGLQAQPIPGFKERPLKIVPPSDLLCGNSVSPGDGPQGFALLDHVIRVSLLVGS